MMLPLIASHFIDLLQQLALLAAFLTASRAVSGYSPVIC